MPKQAVLRYAWLIGLLLLLALSACGRATATPEVTPPALTTEGAATPRATQSTPEVTTHPTETPLSPTPLAMPTAELPFPALLRTLNFGVPAGNSYSLAELVVGGGRLYLTDSIGKLHILDSTTYRELATLPAAGNLILDPALHRLYAASGESVTVVDTTALTVTKVLTPGGSVGWDTERNRLYVGQAAVYNPLRFGPGGAVYDRATLSKLREMPIGGKVVYNPLRDELLIVARTVYRADADTLEFVGDLLPDISAQQCPECEGQHFAADVQVLADRNLLAVTIGQTGRGGGCGPSTRFFDATTLEPVTDPARTQPREPTCNSQRGLLDRVYQAMTCGGYYRNLLVYDLQGNLLTWRDGLDSGVINPNTCQAYVSGVQEDKVLVLDLPSLTPAGTLPKATYTVDAGAGRLYGLTGSELLVFAENGGRPEAPSPPTEAGPLPAAEISWMGASPGFDRDHTIFVQLSSPGFVGLYRSSDGGATWVHLRGGLGAAGYTALAMSPRFADDHILFAAGSAGMLGVLRSTDAGDTWQPIWAGLTNLAVQRLAVSPQYATDGTLLAYSTYHDLLQPTGPTTSVSRSTDRGLHWTLVATGTVPSPEELLPPDPRSADLRFRQGYWWGVDRWTSAVGSWQPVLRLPQSVGVARAVLASPNIASNGTVYVLAEAGLFLSTDRGDTWARCPDSRLDGGDYAHQPTTGVWAGDQLLIATRSGELVFLDPSTLQCEPMEVTSLWSTVLAGSYVVEIAAEPQTAAAVNPAPAVWLADQSGSRLYRYDADTIQAQYGTADGLPRFPTGLALTANGVLWASGVQYPGVASFDGQTWTPHPLPELPSGGEVLRLAASPDGTVWAIAQPPGVYRWVGEAWELLADPQRQLDEGTMDIAIAADGSPWVATRRGLAHYARGAWTAHDVGESIAVAIGPGGEVYGLQPGGLVWRFAQSVWTKLPPPETEVGLLHTLYAARDGSVWMGADSGAFRYDGRAWEQFTLASGLPGQRVLTIAEDASGGLWFGTENGAARVDPEQLDLSPVAWTPGVAVPFPTLTPTPTPWPSPTPLPVLDASRVAERFASAYADAWVAARLRRPREEASTTQAALQAFEHGLMLWRADTKQIYVLYADGSWSNYSDTWDESQPVDDPARVPPDGLYQPVRGFGKLWRSEVGLALKLGWALAPEQGYQMVSQWFEGGRMVLGPQEEIYILLPFWTWERR